MAYVSRSAYHSEKTGRDYYSVYAVLGDDQAQLRMDATIEAHKALDNKRVGDEVNAVLDICPAFDGRAQVKLTKVA